MTAPTTPSLPDALRACIELGEMESNGVREAVIAERSALGFIRQHGPALEALLRERDLSAMAATTEAERGDKLMAERDSLRDLCGAAYQAAGASDWPVEWLDNFSDAANGDPLRHDVASLLPFRPDVPMVHGFDPSPARRTVTLEWPDGRCLPYVLDATRYTDTPEVAAALAGPKP